MESLNSGKEMCRKCHGRGYHTGRSIDLKTMCRYCGGRKDVDWIDYISGNPSPHPHDFDFRRNIAIENAQRLMQQIKEILYKEGIYAIISIERCPNPEYFTQKYHIHQNQVSPSLIGLKNIEPLSKKLLFHI